MLKAQGHCLVAAVQLLSWLLTRDLSCMCQSVLSSAATSCMLSPYKLASLDAVAACKDSSYNSKQSHAKLTSSVNWLQ